MKIPKSIRNIIIEIICLLCILLFVYASVSKIVDFENFSVQLGQSPMLSAFAGWVAILVPLSELIIAIMLAIPRTRFVGLVLAFSLMAMFTAYIYIILNYGSYVPCSCGGVLEKLSWQEHLLFNLFFVLLLFLAIILDLTSKEDKFFKRPLQAAFRILILFVFNIITMALLYVWSEDIIHHRNNFVRRYSAFSEPESKKLDLKSSSFYFAGADGSTIYLGNTLAPRMLLAINTSFNKVDRILIELDHMDLPFRAVHIRVAPPFFYLTDGTVPCVFRGNLKDWKAKLIDKQEVPFTHAEPIDSLHMVIRAIHPTQMQNSLALLDFNSSTNPIWKPGLIISQKDGIFDSDGLLFRNGYTSDFHYIYFYRNEFFRLDSSLIMRGRAHTIDTVYQANLKVAYLKDRHERKLSAPPLIVNRTAAAYDNLLFVNSQLIGRYEDAQMWRQASIIDVYNINNNSYDSSFYIYHVENKPMRSFMVQGNTLYALSGNWISKVPLNKDLTNKYKSKSVNLTKSN